MKYFKAISAFAILFGFTLALPARPEITPSPTLELLEARQKVNGLSFVPKPSASGLIVNGVSLVSVTPTACSLASSAPTTPSTFKLSGATDFLNQFLTDNGNDDWLNKMDSKSTGNPSALRCESLGGTTCPIPDSRESCASFNPPELYFIRVAATNAHDFFTAAHETLQDTVITDILKIDKILADFVAKPDDPDTTADSISAAFTVLQTAFSITNKLVGAAVPEIGVVSTGIEMIGGVFEQANALASLPGGDSAEISIDDIKQQVEAFLATTFNSFNDNIAALNSALFGGPNSGVDLDKLASFVNGIKPGQSNTPVQCHGCGGHGLPVQNFRRDSVLDDSISNPIAKFFDTGIFLQPLSQDPLKDSIKDAFDLINQQLAVTVLAAQNFFVFLDTDIQSEDACLKIEGASFISNQCYTLVQRTVASISCNPDQTVIPGVVAKLTDQSGDYKVAKDDFYLSVRECGNGTPSQDLDIGGNPKCTFQIPFVAAGTTVCNAQGQAGLPANLQITQDGCHKTVSISHC